MLTHISCRLYSVASVHHSTCKLFGPQPPFGLCQPTSGRSDSEEPEGCLSTLNQSKITMANSQLLALACLAVLAASAVAAPAAGACTVSKYIVWVFQLLSDVRWLVLGSLCGTRSCSKSGDTFAQR
jgi:hypothetical protein